MVLSMRLDCVVEVKTRGRKNRRPVHEIIDTFAPSKVDDHFDQVHDKLFLQFAVRRQHISCAFLRSQ